VRRYAAVGSQIEVAVGLATRAQPDVRLSTSSCARCPRASVVARLTPDAWATAKRPLPRLRLYDSQAGGLIHLKEKFHGFQKSLAGRSCRTVLRAAFFGFFFGTAATVPVDSGPSAATVAVVGVSRDSGSD
jgi:hypothetical protein